MHAALHALTRYLYITFSVHMAYNILEKHKYANQGNIIRMKPSVQIHDLLY